MQELITEKSIRLEILKLIESITPFDLLEQEHLSFTKQWIDSGVEIFRIAKPATPDTHLVSYFLLFDQTARKILLVDHKKAGLWLPTGGHVEPNEHPMQTVKREIVEELGIEADFLLSDPFFLTVTKTVGQTAGHIDISFWYLLKGDSNAPLNYDKEEFKDIHWFDLDSIPYKISDPHMERFMQKLQLIKNQS